MEKKERNEISVSNDDGVIKNQEDFIGFGGKMEPENIEKGMNVFLFGMIFVRKKGSI